MPFSVFKDLFIQRYIKAFLKRSARTLPHTDLKSLLKIFQKRLLSSHFSSRDKSWTFSKIRNFPTAVTTVQKHEPFNVKTVVTCLQRTGERVHVLPSDFCFFGRRMEIKKDDRRCFLSLLARHSYTAQ